MLILRDWNKRSGSKPMQQCLTLKPNQHDSSELYSRMLAPRSLDHEYEPSTERPSRGKLRWFSKIMVLIITCISTGIYLEEELSSISIDGIHRSLCISGALRRRMQLGDRLLCDTHTVLDEETFALSYPQEFYYPDYSTTRPNGTQNIAFVVTIPSCSKDDSTQPSAIDDAGYSFYDAAAILKQSVCNCTLMNNETMSKYNSTMYAIIHPEAISCKGPIDGLDAHYLGLPPQDYNYDRVAILEELGFWVIIWKEPLYLHQIENEYLKDEIQYNAGIRDLLHLHAYNLTNHQVAVMMDFDTIFKEPIDALIDELINDPNKKSLHTKKADGNVNTGMLLVKPDESELIAITKGFSTTPYDRHSGWNGSGIEGMGVDGFLTYYYDQNSDQNTESASFDDSTVVSFASNSACAKPWECHYDETWDEETKNVCRELNEAWFHYRKDFEEHWTKKHLVDTSAQDYHKDFFLGYCKSEGVDGYPRASDHRNAPTMAPTPYPCDSDTQTNSVISHLRHDGRVQDQKLTLTTPRRARDFNGQSQYCVSGTVTDLSFAPPFNILFALDVSGSTRSRFQGSRNGQVTDVGHDNTILESEVIGCLKMLEFIAKSDNLSNDNVNIGIVTFSTEAKYHGIFAPLDPADQTKVNPELKTILTGLKGDGWTNFDGALDNAILFFEEAPEGWNNIMYFLSDGIPNVSGDHDGEAKQITSDSNNNHISTISFDWELERLDEFGVKRHAIGVSSGSDIRRGFGLSRIDNTPDRYGNGPEQVMSKEALVDAIMSNTVVGEIVHLAVKANGVTNYDIGADDLIPGPTGYIYDDLVVLGLNTSIGFTNKVRVELILDYDGNINTKEDQNIVIIENEIPGAL